MLWRTEKSLGSAGNRTLSLYWASEDLLTYVYVTRPKHSSRLKRLEGYEIQLLQAPAEQYLEHTLNTGVGKVARE